MTNAEKFREVFGLEPDLENCPPILCPPGHEHECEYYEELEGGCNCERWWEEPYDGTIGAFKDEEKR